MNQQFENLLDRSHNGSMKWEASYIQKRFSIDVLANSEIFPMFIADMDYPMDSLIYKHLQDALKQPDFGYFHVQESYFTSILHWHQKVHHIQVQREWILPSIGTITSLHIACAAFAKDEPIAFMTPVYGPFKNCSTLGKTNHIDLLLVNNRYEIDFEALQACFQKQKIKVLLFCNPHNPSGRMWSRSELETLVLLCKQYQVILLSDEIHSDIKLCDHPFVSLIEFCDVYDQILVSTSPNKTFNISGLNTSYVLCANSDMRFQYQHFLDQLHLSSNRLGILMSEIVYTHGLPWLEKLLPQIKANVDFVMEALQATNIQVMRPDCGYLVWMHLPNIDDIDRFILDLAKATHVLLETGSRFLHAYDGYIRINVATSASLLSVAMDRFVHFYEQYEKTK